MQINSKTLKRLVFCFGLCIIQGAHFRIEAQEMIPNGSFEIQDSCPNFFGMIGNASPWFQPCTMGSSTDLFSSCTSNPDISTPLNFDGYQVPQHGVSYAGFQAYSGFTTDQREYIEVELNNSLIAGQEYRFRGFFSSSNEAMYSVNRIGIVFSVDSIQTTAFNVIDSIPEIFLDTLFVINDTANWILLETMYTATGGERFITIGNFFTDAATMVSVSNASGYGWAYYYLDSISLTIYDTGIPNNSAPLNVSVNTFLKLDDKFTATNLPSNSCLNIYDSRGRIVYRNENYQNDLSGNELSFGMYLYEFILPDSSRKTGKLVVQ
jgi:hypothetical protein